MPSVIEFRCPTCQAKIKAPIQLLGRMRPCPACSTRFVVRYSAPKDAGPLLVEDETPAATTSQ